MIVKLIVVYLMEYWADIIIINIKLDVWPAIVMGKVRIIYRHYH